MSGTSLAQWLRSTDDEAIAALLHARPDLATPAPADMSVLATRAGIRASVVRACEGLDTMTLTVLEAAIALGADTAAITRLDVARMLGTAVPAAATRQGIDRLRSLALLWGSDNAISAVPAARETMPRYPGGLGGSAPQLAERDLAGELAQLDERQRALIDRLADPDGPPIGRTSSANRTVVSLLVQGLLLRQGKEGDQDVVELPREVALAARGDAPFGPVRATEPSIAGAPVDPERVAGTAAGAATEMLRLARAVLDDIAAQPPGVLRSGGLGIREVRRLAKELGTEEHTIALLVELLAAAGLLAPGDGAAPTWMPTVGADVWSEQPVEQRWLLLAQHWLELPRLPGLVGTRQERDRVLGPLVEELRRPGTPTDRRRVLGALAELAEGTTADPDDVAALLSWRRPRRGGKLRDDLVRWTLAEATTLGLVALDALTAQGRALLAGNPGDAAEAMSAALPEPVEQVMVQADLSVVAPGPLVPQLAAEMDLVADVESAGGATVFRLSEDSVRRALDAGRTAADLHELFRTRSTTPVPQSLSYLIDDVARRHGRLRAGTAASFLRCEDEVLLTELLAGRAGEAAGLRRLAPTVAVSQLPVTDVLSELRRQGYSPAAEDTAGQLLDLRGGQRRLPGGIKGLPRATGGHIPDEEQLREIVKRVRAGDRTISGSGAAAATGPSGARSSDASRSDAERYSETVHLLQRAANHQRSVWIGYVDSHGTAYRREVAPVNVGGGVLEGFDHTQGSVRRFALHRITSAVLADEQASEAH